jgi:hypothetical protein
MGTYAANRENAPVAAHHPNFDVTDLNDSEVVARNVLYRPQRNLVDHD